MKRAAILITVISTLFLNAQDVPGLSYYLPQDISYDDAIPTPASVLGHEVGEWHVTHDKLLFYMQALAASSDRIQIENRGTTYEGRPLVLLTISSPENLRNRNRSAKNTWRPRNRIQGLQARPGGQ